MGAYNLMFADVRLQIGPATEDSLKAQVSVRSALADSFSPLYVDKKQSKGTNHFMGPGSYMGDNQLLSQLFICHLASVPIKK